MRTRRGPRGYVPARRGPQTVTLRPKAGPFRGIVWRSQKDRDEAIAAWRALGSPKTKQARKGFIGTERFRLLLRLGHPAPNPSSEGVAIFRAIPSREDIQAVVDTWAGGRDDSADVDEWSIITLFYRVV